MESTYDDDVAFDMRSMISERKSGSRDELNVSGRDSGAKACTYSLFQHATARSRIVPSYLEERPPLISKC
jgi:hypothetical protein